MNEGSGKLITNSMKDKSDFEDKLRNKEIELTNILKVITI
jgi:hypothetical protein